MRGNIVTPWAGRAKEYAWNLCLDLAPRLITPTDIDYLVEHNYYFLLFEMKTKGCLIPKGQRLVLYRLLECLKGRAVLCVVHHEEVEKIILPHEAESFDLFLIEGERLVTRRYEGKRFKEFYAQFFRWAAGKEAECYLPNPRGMAWEQLSSVTEL